MVVAWREKCKQLLPTLQLRPTHTTDTPTCDVDLASTAVVLLHKHLLYQPHGEGCTTEGVVAEIKRTLSRDTVVVGNVHEGRGWVSGR